MSGASAGRRTGRELGVAVLGAAAAGGLALAAGGQGWAEVTAYRPPPLPPARDLLIGAEAAPLVPAAGLLLLAAAVALVAVRGVGRSVVGLLVAAAGGAMAWSGLRAFLGGLDRAAMAATGDAMTTIDLRAGWPALALAAGLLGVGVGLLTVVRGRSWPAMGRRYERPGNGVAAGGATAPRAPTGEDRASAAWQALDRGEDPTDGPSAAARPPGARRD